MLETCCCAEEVLRVVLFWVLADLLLGVGLYLAALLAAIIFSVVRDVMLIQARFVSWLFQL